MCVSGPKCVSPGAISMNNQNPLNAYLIPTGSPYDQNTNQVSGFEFGYMNESGVVSSAQLRNASIKNAQLGTAIIGTAQIGTLSFNEITGGTALLGGTLNGNGVLDIKLADGDNFIVANSGSLAVYSPQMQASNQLLNIIPSENLVYIKDLYVGGTFGGTPAQDGNILIYGGTIRAVGIASAAGITTYNGLPITLGGTASQSAGTANTCVLYVDFNGSKNRLMALFNSGTAVVVATQP